MIDITDPIEHRRLSAEALLKTGHVEAGTTGLIEAARLLESAHRIDEAIDVLTMAIDAMDECDRRLEVLEHTARIASDGEHVRANNLWNQVVKGRAGSGDANSLARALYFQSWVAPASESQQLLDEARGLGTEEFGWAAKAASVFAFREADYTRSATHNLRALELARIAGDATLEAAALHSLSLAQMMDGRMADAITLLRQSIALAMMLGDRHSAVSSQLNLIQMLQADACCEEAVEMTDDLVRYVDEHGLRAWQSEAWALRAAILSNCGYLDEARAAYRHCSEVDSRLVNESSAMYTSYYMAATAYELGYLDDALLTCERTHIAACMRNDRLGILLVTALRARCLVRLGDSDTAFSILKDSSFDDPMATPEITAWMVQYGLRTGCMEWIDLANEIIEGLHIEGEMVAASQLFLDVTRGASMGTSAEIAASVLECADALTSRGRRVDALRCRIAVSGLLAREGSKDEALQLASAAHRELVDLGSPLDIEYTTDLISELAESGAMPRKGRVRTSSLAPAQINLLAPFLTSMNFDRGKGFFEQGDILQAVYVVRQGRVRLSTLEADGKQLTIAILEEGDVFGESALLGDGTVSQLAAEAMEEGVVGSISAAAMRRLINEKPALAMSLVSIVAERMQRAQRLAVQLAFSSVEQRLVHLIAELDERYGHPTLDGARIVNCTFTQSELAEMIGARRDTVSQLLSGLRRDGYIEMRRRRITILDLDWLAKTEL
jgi:CRP/FNR family transcriptional regulator